MFYDISGKRWLQAAKWHPRVLINALEGRYEKFNYLTGTLLILAGIGLLVGGLAGFINHYITFWMVLLLAAPVAVMMHIGTQLFSVRSRHKWWIENFTTRKDPFRRLIPSDDIVFRSVMFPQYVDYLTGRKRADIDIEAWEILENYVREALNQEEIISMEIEAPDCTELEAINLRFEYESFVLHAAKLAGAKIAAVLELDTNSFFDKRALVLKQKYRSSLVMLIEGHSAMNQEAEKILESLD